MATNLQLVPVEEYDSVAVYAHWTPMVSRYFGDTAVVVVEVHLFFLAVDVAVNYLGLPGGLTVFVGGQPVQSYAVVAADDLDNSDRNFVFDAGQQDYHVDRPHLCSNHSF